MSEMPESEIPNQMASHQQKFSERKKHFNLHPQRRWHANKYKKRKHSNN